MVIERLLVKHGIEFKTGGSYFQIRCLSPDHDDKNPSMFVNQYSGWANCRSCGASYNLFDIFNANPSRTQLQKDKFRQKLQKTLEESTFYEIPADAVFYNMSFKGISAEVIRKFQAFQFNEFPGYLFFPLRNIQGKIVNFIGRDMLGDRKPKYLFLYKKPVLMGPLNEPYLGSIILVEGIFDALNLYQYGITNVRALFGVTTFSQEHIDLFKLEGIDEVIIMLDGDTAGRDASQFIKSKLDEEFISNKIISLKEGTDPGNLNKETVLKLKDTLYGISSYSGNKA